MTNFTNGDKIEVLSTTTVYYSATVLRPPHDGTIHVKYDTRWSTCRRKRLKEHVAMERVREVVPVELHRCFKEGEVVDVEYEGGGMWRVGRVVEILEGGKYAVESDGEERETVEVEQWRLRVHRDWDWVSPLPDHTVISSEPTEEPRKLKLRIKFSGREPKFCTGAIVEVKHDREGCQGSWFNAVIVDSIGDDKIVVEYQSDRADTKSETFKDIVDASYVRPCPPEIARVDRYMQSEEVDVFFNGGWWMGHISKVLGDDKYLICLGSKNDVLIVDHSKVRTRQDWIDGKWVAYSLSQLQQNARMEIETECYERQPKTDSKLKECNTRSKRISDAEFSKGTVVEVKSNEEGYHECYERQPKTDSKLKECNTRSKRISDAEFSKGTVVEVKSNEEGYHGSWYTAVIIDSVEKDMYMIEYQTLKTEDESKLLEEKTDVFHIRPCPPSIQRLDRFRLFERVDVWYNDGWWVGIITRILEGLNYTVFFWTTNEELQCRHFTLRPHQEWLNGKFIADFMKPSVQLPPKPKPGKSKRDNSFNPVKANLFPMGMKVEIRSDEEGYSGTWYPAVVLGPKGNGNFLVEYKTLKADGKMELLKEVVDSYYMRPSLSVAQCADPFKPFEEVEAWYNNAWWHCYVCEVFKGSKYGVRIKSTDEVVEFQHSELRRYKDWAGGKWTSPPRSVSIT